MVRGDDGRPSVLPGGATAAAVAHGYDDGIVLRRELHTLGIHSLRLRNDIMRSHVSQPASQSIHTGLAVYQSAVGRTTKLPVVGSTGSEEDKGSV
jgi:hypothetical protein